MDTSASGSHGKSNGNEHHHPANLGQSLGECFRDNLEHLQALEEEALLHLTVASARTSRTQYRADDEDPELSIPESQEIQQGETIPDPCRIFTAEELEPYLARLVEGNRIREIRSTSRGIPLLFNQLCKAYSIDEFEKLVVLLLFACGTSTRFKSALARSPFARSGSPSLGDLLAITSRDYREQLGRRRYFSVEGTLVKEEVILIGGRMDDTTNILSSPVCLHERITRYILGDNHIYNSSVKNIIREKGCIDLGRVVMPEDEKQKVVNLAHAIPAITAVGEARGVRIFLRRSEGFNLPAALVTQNTLVTAFCPPGADGKPADFGLMDFTRPDVLAQFQPGNDEVSHTQLLEAALRLAVEEPERGGRASILARGPEFQGCPYWRYITPDQNLKRAGMALARLYVPTQSGAWAPAASVVRIGTWPGRPVLDEKRLQTIGANALAGLDSVVSLDAHCGLLGVGGIPLDSNPGGLPCIDGWEMILGGPLEPLSQAARTILGRWSTDLDHLTMHEDGKVIRNQLLRSPWLTSDLGSEVACGNLHEGLIAKFPLRPVDLWWQDPQGVRTKLLPRVERSKEPAPWMLALGIGGIEKGDEERSHRVLAALESLHRVLQFPEPDISADLESTYTALIRALPDNAGDIERVPVLVRRFNQGATTRKVSWRAPGESVWHDDATASHALVAFSDYSLWVVRRDPKRIADVLNIRNFNPGNPKVERIGDENPSLRRQMEEALYRALPDLFAAAEAAPVAAQFNAEQALKLQATLRVHHAADAWLVYSFDGKQGRLGEGEGEDVFLVPETDSDPRHLVFDGTGPKPPLAECARPLSELFCEKNAFFDTFTAGLEAWSKTESLADSVPFSVRRFRRTRGISDLDVARWRDQLEASRLDSAHRDEWKARVVRALARFGNIDRNHIHPGLSIKPNVWIDDEKFRGDATTAEVETALRDAFGDVKDGTGLKLLLPAVAIAESHEQAFRLRTELSQLKPYIAAAAMHRGRSFWNEELLSKLQEIGRREPDANERAEFHRLRCDHDGMLRQRFGLPAIASLDVGQIDAAALAFAGGEIPITQPPNVEPTPGELVGWKSEATASTIEPISEEAWLQNARRHATGGARAEAAIWIQTDSSSFYAVLRTALGRLLEESRICTIFETARKAPTDQSLSNLLQVSGYAGNAGFDLLFPRFDERKILRVEVKRISSLDNAAFYLSENERRQALAMKDNWRLWLVASDGKSRDVSWIRNHLEKTRDQVAGILESGMRPGDWLFRVKYTAVQDALETAI